MKLNNSQFTCSMMEMGAENSLWRNVRGNLDDIKVALTIAKSRSWTGVIIYNNGPYDKEIRRRIEDIGFRKGFKYKGYSDTGYVTTYYLQITKGEIESKPCWIARLFGC